VTPPKTKGFGSLLVERALSGDLGDACIEFAPAGVVCTVEIALG
jgi:two-component sensor histidine kinase